MPGKTPLPAVRFGPYEAYFAQGELRKHGARIKIQGKPLSILELLVKRQGEIVSREELRAALWPEDVFVDFEKNLSTAVNKLRVVLCDSAESPRYVETIPRRGYRFLMPVEVCGAAGQPPGLTPIEGDTIGMSIRLPDVVEAETRPYAEAVERALAGEKAIRGPLRVSRHWLFWVGVAVGGATVILFALLSAFSGGRGKAKVRETDTLVLADFANSTGDSVFDTAARQALWFDMEQSPYINLLSDVRVQETLALMAKPKTMGLTPEVAREVCQRTASAAMIDGSISRIDKQYVIGLKAVACRSGDVLASEVATAEGKERVLKAIHDACTRLRGKLGESLASVQKYDRPAEDVTTSSLGALEAYSLGYQASGENEDWVGAAEQFERAVRLDPQFAMAYARAAACYGNIGEGALAAKNARKAHELRDRLSARETFYVDANYENYTTGDREASRKIYEVWAQTYPRDSTPVGRLANIHSDDFGRYEDALQERLKALNLEPNGFNYGNLVMNYLELNRFEDVRAMVREAVLRGRDTPSLHELLYMSDFLEGDAEPAAQELATLKKVSAREGYYLAFEASSDAYNGRFRQSRELSRRASEWAERNGERGEAAYYEAAQALSESLVGNEKLAKQYANEALRELEGKEAEGMAAIALALAGEPAKAGRLAAKLETNHNSDALVRFKYVPNIRAAMALKNAQPQAAIDSLTVGAPYELGAYGEPFLGVYLRGVAYLMQRRGTEAAADFQKIRDHSGVVGNEVIGALAHLGLARANALKSTAGHEVDADAARVRAIADYKEFLALWKDGDPDIPIMKQAKAEYAKLQ